MFSRKTALAVFTAAGLLAASSAQAQIQYKTIPSAGAAGSGLVYYTQTFDNIPNATPVYAADSYFPQALNEHQVLAGDFADNGSQGGAAPVLVSGGAFFPNGIVNSSPGQFGTIGSPLTAGQMANAAQTFWSPSGGHLSIPAADISTLSQRSFNTDGSGGFASGQAEFRYATGQTPAATMVIPAGTLPSGLVNLSFKLAGVGDLDGVSDPTSRADGYADAAGGPLAAAAMDQGDRFIIRVNGKVVFDETFGNDANPGSWVNNPGVKEIVSASGTFDGTPLGAGNLNFNANDPSTGTEIAGTNPADSLYEVSVNAPSNGGALTIEFFGGGSYEGLGAAAASAGFANQGELFAINDLVIRAAVTPEPGSILLFGIVLGGGVGAYTWRRRRSQA